MNFELPLIAERYELIELIGRGGMGDVYRGRDIVTGQAVAVKRLHSDIVEDNPDIVDRFKREGEALRQLNHPNIVNLLATLEENGRHYLVMEYVSGGSLRDLLDSDGRLPIEAVLNLALDLADALTRAHRLNIIHRDIKPDNVLLAEDGTPRLTDFGVACLRDRTRLTQTGSVIGTYAYLSPEACNGLELDERTDIWSFGVMLFEMLAGRVPFHEESTAAILTAILMKPAPDLQVLRPGAPPVLVDLVYRMLEKDRDRRLGSVRLIGAELEAIIRGLDTPLGSLVFADYDPHSSRFATPSNQGERVPAMERSTPRELHGPSRYPGAGSGEYPTMYTPGGTPLTTTELSPISVKWRWITVMVIFTVLACSTVSVIALLLQSDRTTERPLAGVTPSAVATAVGAISLPLAVPTPAPVVPPVDPGETMVLVADFEDLGGIGQLATRKRDVARFVADELRDSLEKIVPFSNIRIRRYPRVITSDDEARAAAQEAEAAVIIWGNYTPEQVQLEIQVGATDSFPYMAFERDVLERTANVRVELADERSESVAPYVLTVLNVLHLAAGDGFESMRTGAIMDAVNVKPARAVGSSAASHVHRLALAAHNTAAVDTLNAALEIDPGNPILYVLRSIVRQQQGRYDNARADAQTAQRVGPPSWAMPDLLLAAVTDDDSALGFYDNAIAQRPDDWFPRFLRGTIYYERRDELPNGAALARADLDEAIALEPAANFPYVYSALLAFHEGRMQDAGEALRVVLTEFPDPTYMDRLVRTMYGDAVVSPFAVTLAAFTNLALGRYGETLQDALTGLSAYPGMEDLRFLQGLAYCTLGEYQAAERSFSRAIGLNTQFYLAYLLRADARLQQGATAAAGYDFAIIRRGPLAEEFAPYEEAVRQGELACATFFSPANPLLMPAPLPTPAPPTPTIIGVPADAVSAVAPAEPGELLLLVARLEPIGASQRDVERFLVDDLERTFEEEMPISQIRVQHYPRTITSPAEARRVAEATGASFIIWGNYTPTFIELEVQAGVLQGFPHIPFERQTVERTANVRVHLTDERRQSVAGEVLGLWNILALADGDQYQIALSLMLLDGLAANGGEIIGNSAAAHLHRGLAIFTTDTPGAIEHMRAALTVDSGNPLVYAYLSMANRRLGDIEQQRRDWQSARRLGPDTWTMPLYLTPDDDLATVLQAYNRITELRPDDWYAYFMRGMTYYYDALDLKNARADLEHSVALEPHNNVSYLVAMLLALRQGRLTDAQVLMDVVLTQYPDPDLTHRAYRALYGDDPGAKATATLFSAGTNLALGQYDRVVSDVTETADYVFSQPVVPGTLGERVYDLSDLFLMQGLAYCNLKAYSNATNAYGQAIKFGGGYEFANLLRAQSHLSQVNLSRATADFAAARRHNLGTTFDAWIDHAERGEWNCETFFDYEITWQRAPRGF